MDLLRQSAHRIHAGSADCHEALVRGIAAGLHRNHRITDALQRRCLRRGGRRRRVHLIQRRLGRSQLLGRGRRRRPRGRGGRCHAPRHEHQANSHSNQTLFGQRINSCILGAVGQMPPKFLALSLQDLCQIADCALNHAWHVSCFIYRSRISTASKKPAFQANDGTER